MSLVGCLARRWVVNKHCPDNPYPQTASDLVPDPTAHGATSSCDPRAVCRYCVSRKFESSPLAGDDASRQPIAAAVVHVRMVNIAPDASTRARAHKLSHQHARVNGYKGVVATYTVASLAWPMVGDGSSERRHTRQTCCETRRRSERRRGVRRIRSLPEAQYPAAINRSMQPHNGSPGKVRARVSTDLVSLPSWILSEAT